LYFRIHAQHRVNAAAGVCGYVFKGDELMASIDTLVLQQRTILFPDSPPHHNSHDLLVNRADRQRRGNRRMRLLTFLSICLPQGVFAATSVGVGYVQSNYSTPQSPVSSVTVPYKATQASGDLNVIVVGWNDSSATVNKVADSSGNTYSLAVGPTVVSGALTQSIYFAKNIATAAAGRNTVTVTFSRSAVYPDVRILEYNGADLVNPVDVAAASSGRSSSSSASAITASATDLIFGANIVQSLTGGPGSGFTQRLLTQPDGDIAEDEMVQTAGSHTAAAPVSGTAPWIMQMVAFRTPSNSSDAITPTPSALSCSSSSMTGSGTDSCTLTLSASAPSGGQTVTLKSSSSSVTVPSSVTVASGAKAATFSASVSAVSTAQSVTLSASAGGASETFTLQLNPAAATLSINATSITFGDVNLNTTATQSLILTSTGSSPVTVSSAAITGTGFSYSGLTLPVTLSPKQSATMSVNFDPKAAGAATGKLTISSNSSSNPSAAVGLSGTGQSASSSVGLAWQAPSGSSDPVASYNIYRSTSGGSSYQLLGSVSNTQLAYTDTTVQSGQTYDYTVESVDSSGVESVPSNMASAAIP
jgi:hypothetical protein